MSKLTEFNEQLMGAPGGVLLFLFCIGLGYGLKAIPWVKNYMIPILLVAFGIVLWVAFAPEVEGEKARQFYARNVMIGGIIPMASWLFHRFALKRLEKKWGGESGFDSSPNAFTKPPEQKDKQ